MHCSGVLQYLIESRETLQWFLQLTILRLLVIVKVVLDRASLTRDRAGGGAAPLPSPHFLWIKYVSQNEKYFYGIKVVGYSWRTSQEEKSQFDCPLAIFRFIEEAGAAPALNKLLAGPVTGEIETLLRLEWLLKSVCFPFVPLCLYFHRRVRKGTKRSLRFCWGMEWIPKPSPPTNWQPCRLPWKTSILKYKIYSQTTKRGTYGNKGSSS